jgi:UDP-N-acetylglucosamine 2-epimerase
MMKKSKGWKNPFGDGHAGEKIIEITMKSAGHSI